MAEYEKAAQEVRHKVEFYFVALAFTVAGFSIQTAHHREHLAANVLEVGSWFALIASGMLGLRRIEDMPVVYRSLDAIDKANSSRDTILNPHLPGADASQHQERITRLTGESRRMYIWQKALLVLGFLLLAFSRTWALFADP